MTNYLELENPDDGDDDTTHGDRVRREIRHDLAHPHVPATIYKYRKQLVFGPCPLGVYNTDDFHSLYDDATEEDDNDNG